MLLWINGAFGAGKTSVATGLVERIDGARLYDPEHVGFFLGSTVPPSPTGDFQDLPIWRTLVADVAIALDRHYGGTLVVPMTIADPQYFDEICGPIEDAGIEIDRRLLDVPAQVLRERIVNQVMNPDDAADDRRIRDWRLGAVDRCVAAFGAHDFGRRVSNVDRSVADTVDEIVASLG